MSLSLLAGTTVTLCMLGNLRCIFVILLTCFQNEIKKKKSFRNNISVREFQSRSEIFWPDLRWYKLRQKSPPLAAGVFKFNCVRVLIVPPTAKVILRWGPP